MQNFMLTIMNHVQLAILLDAVSGLNNLQNWMMRIGQGIVGCGVVYGAIHCFINFAGGNIQKGLIILTAVIIGVIVFAIAPSLTKEIAGLFA